MSLALALSVMVLGLPLIYSEAQRMFLANSKLAVEPYLSDSLKLHRVEAQWSTMVCQSASCKAACMVWLLQLGLAIELQWAIT